MFETHLQEYENAVHSITVFFARKYFGDYYQYNTGDWVGQVVGGVICINDYWFNFDDMLQYLKYGYTKKQMFAYYDYALDCTEDKRSKLKKVYMLIIDKHYDNNPICIRDWKKLSQKK